MNLGSTLIKGFLNVTGKIKANIIHADLIEANNATTSVAGLLSPTDKQRVDNSLQTSGGTMTGSLTMANTTGILNRSSNFTNMASITNLNGALAIQPYNDDGTKPAFIGFNRPGKAWGAFGMDIDGLLKFAPIGGGSSFKIWHEGNDGSGSGLEADTTDGYHATAESAANTIAVRNPGGYLFSPTIYANSPTGRQIQASSWSYLSSSGDGKCLFSNNSYLNASDSTYHYSNAHDGLGAMGILLNWNAGLNTQPYFFNMGNIATTPDAAFTPNVFKMWHEGNDGSGSGLDADLLEGRHAGNGDGQIPVSNGVMNFNLNAHCLDGVYVNRIPYGSNATATTSVTDFNAMYKSGFYDTNNGTGVPWNTYWHCIHNAHSNTGATNQYSMQLATPFWEDVLMFRRQSPDKLGAGAQWYSVVKSTTGIHNITRSTADPSGGVDGDIWIKYNP